MRAMIIRGIDLIGSEARGVAALCLIYNDRDRASRIMGDVFNLPGGITFITIYE